MKASGILIVEDENIVALDMRMRLESMSYRVVDVVDTGELAIERALADAPDLVLMDIKLKGGTDGIETARSLRERVEVPVIFVTAFTDERTLERAKLASPYGYIVKPFHERELRIAIELALYKHQYEVSMRHAKELAEEANRLKSEFLANMSHELKTPLNSVIGFTQLALDRAIDDEQRGHLGMAIGSAKSLLNLIESILDFARMEAGLLATPPVPFSLDAVLGDCVDAFAVGAHTKGLEASFRREASIPDALIGDANLLRHIVMNLLDNAVKFTERGRIRLAVALDAGPAEGLVRIGIGVSDTGIGMPKHRIESAFERFTQLDASRTRRAGGTGLGLAIVQKSVELMKGTIKVDSELGAGTRVMVELPFAVATGKEALPVQGLLEGRRAVLVGFDDEAYPDAAATVESLGAICAPGRNLSDDSVTRADALVLVDERAVPASEAALAILSGRLIVATRFGGKVRGRLAAYGGIAFAPLPLRRERIAAAVDSLVNARALSSIAARSAIVPPADLASEAWTRRLARFACLLEEAAAGSDFDLAEREARAIREDLVAAGNSEGERIAFTALLLVRKRDKVGLSSVIERVRSLAAGATLSATDDASGSLQTGET